MILTIEVRLGDGANQGPIVATVRILGPDRTIGWTDYAVGAVERAGACGQPRSAGCIIGHDHRQSLWTLLERASAALGKADFVGL